MRGGHELLVLAIIIWASLAGVLAVFLFLALKEPRKKRPHGDARPFQPR